MNNDFVIVGAGVFGLSTALHLVRSGVRPEGILVLDIYEPPSPWSAACDFNKIIRCEYNSEMYTKLAIEALQLWRSDDLFKASYVECGRLLATPIEHEGRLQFEREGIANLQKYGSGMQYQFWRGGKELSELFNAFKDNNIPEDKEIKWNPESGLGKSGQTLKDIYYYLKECGVRFQFGDKGAIKLVDNEGNVISESGCIYKSERVLISLGANTGKVIDLDNQQSATGLFVTHIQLTDEEYEVYKDIPVVFDADLGYFFQPDEESKRMKICLSGGGIKRIVDNKFDDLKSISLPRFKTDHPNDTIPKERVCEIRNILKQYVPKLQNHELIDHKICWIGDTLGGQFLIDQVPHYSNVYVATGDSGHGFKFFPNIGKYIVQMMNGGVEDKEMADSWKWRDRRNESIVDPAQNKWRITKGTRDITEIDFV